MRLTVPVAVALALASTATQVRAGATVPGSEPSPATPPASTPESSLEPAPESRPELVVELRLNDQPDTTTLIVRRHADGTLLLRAADLTELRLRTPSTGGVLIAGEHYYRLGAEIGAQVTFDDAAQRVSVELPPRAFLPTQSRVNGPDSAFPAAVSPGAFVNYDVSADRVEQATSTGAFVELGLFGAQGVVTGTVAASADDERREAVRLDTTWTRDFPERTATLRVGDAISSPGAWGQSVRFGGVQFGTNFSTQPTRVTTPLLTASGDAVVPSTVDVFVNGQHMASEEVAPGPFSIDHVPSINGAGELQVVVVDALGRQQVLTQPYYTGTALLRAGLSEYSLDLGSIREDYGRHSGRYGALVGAGTLRRGITDDLTAEVHAEAQAGGAVAAGLDAAWRVGVLGIVSATAAASVDTAGSDETGDPDGVGWLAGAGFEHSGRRISVFARTQYMTAAFTRIGERSAHDRPRQRSFVGLGYNLAQYGSLRLAYGLETHWDSPEVETLGLTYSLGLGRFGFLGLSATSSNDADGRRTDLLASWTVPFGARRTASTSLRQSVGADEDEFGGERFEAVATVQQNLPSGSGSGYAVTLSSSDEARMAYAYQGDAGVASIEYARDAGQDGWRVGAVGGLAVTGAGLMTSRRLDQGFAVVQVADYQGLEINVDNRPVGRTDRKGRVLLDRLRAYEANEISLDPASLPMDASLATASMTVTPAWRSGALVRFPVSRGDAAVLRLLRPDGTPVPAGAEVLIRGVSFPVALDGLVQVSGVAEPVAAEARWAGGRCSFVVARPADAGPIPDLGAVTCTPITVASLP